MSIVRDVSTFLWLLIAYIFARYGVVNLDWSALDMNHVVWAHNELFYLTTKDIFLIVGIFLLFIEIYKAATSGEYSVPETIVSFFVAVAYLILFLMWDKAHNATFFMITLMAFIDAVGGFVISINAARKDISIK